MREIILAGMTKKEFIERGALIRFTRDLEYMMREGVIDIDKLIAELKERIKEVDDEQER